MDEVSQSFHAFAYSFSGTFDVQNVTIMRDSELEEYIYITCHFAQGSLITGCRIIIISQTADDGVHEICEYIATREEGSTEALIRVTLPAGHYTIAIYDDEDVAVQNAAYNTTLTVTSSSQMRISGMHMQRYGILMTELIIYLKKQNVQLLWTTQTHPQKTGRVTAVVRLVDNVYIAEQITHYFTPPLQ